MRMILYVIFLLITQLSMTVAANPTAAPAHGFSAYGDLKYPADFTHFEYTNPDAPKGGTLRLGSLGSFDNLNPFIIKGIAPHIMGLTIATLLADAHDRPGEYYAYAAESIEVAPDRSWVVFRLNPNAKFNNGDPVTADDIIWAFETLRDKGLILFRTYYKNVSRVEKLDEHTIRFSFNTTKNRELPMILGQIPVLSKKYYKTHKFDETTLTPPPSSGPYAVESVTAGRFIVLKHVENWWGQSIPSQRGRYNFKSIKVDYYLESNALFEGFKSGQYDLREENVAKNWATGYNFPARERGEVKREEIKHSLSGGTYGLFFNLRRPVFSDIRVRKALTMLFDFPWMNKHLFYGQYIRNKSYYPNSDFEASGIPSAEEKVILQPFEKDLPPEVLTQAFVLPESRNEEDRRATQAQAHEILKSAGYEVRGERIVNTKSGEPLTFEILIPDKSLEKIVLNFKESLARTGIQIHVRTLDPAAYELRVDNLDYDMILGIIGQSPSLGNEQRDYFGSERANTPGTRNYAGIQNPIIDRLIEQLIESKDYPTLVNTSRALDRVLLWNYYMIPAWHNNTTRVAYWNRFSHPQISPKYSGLDITTWWFNSKQGVTRQEKEASKSSIWQRFSNWISGLFNKMP